METLRMRRIQEPSQVERLLDAFITRGNLFPEGAYQLRDPRSVAAQLHPILSRATHEGHAWACWVDRSHTWLFTCEMSLPLSRERGAPVLKVSRYDESGELRDVGTWSLDRDARWVRFGK